MSDTIYECPCGCKLKAWKGERHLMFSSVVEEEQPLLYIDDNGFINGKVSIRPEGETIVRQALQELDDEISSRRFS